jgi:23S rRNA (uridine2552-2'-O)-methyltransferase
MAIVFGYSLKKHSVKNHRCKVHLKKAHKLTLSSRRWLERQLNDTFVKQAQIDGYRARAAYKLLYIHERFHIFKPGQWVVDLGAAPGSWSQVAARYVHVPPAQGRVIALDQRPMDYLEGVENLCLDFTQEDSLRQLETLLTHPVDVVLSDMAANTTGDHRTDHFKIIALVEEAVHFASLYLAPGGHFIAKVLQGGTEKEILQGLKRDFAFVRHIKPPASRQESSEMYLVAMGFRGQKI